MFEMCLVVSSVNLGRYILNRFIQICVLVLDGLQINEFFELLVY